MYFGFSSELAGDGVFSLSVGATPWAAFIGFTNRIPGLHRDERRPLRPCPGKRLSGDGLDVRKSKPFAPIALRGHLCFVFPERLGLQRSGDHRRRRRKRHRRRSSSRTRRVAPRPPASLAMSARPHARSSWRVTHRTSASKTTEAVRSPIELLRGDNAPTICDFPKADPELLLQGNACPGPGQKDRALCYGRVHVPRDALVSAKIPYSVDYHVPRGRRLRGTEFGKTSP
jgi:hypothetical protein